MSSLCSPNRNMGILDFEKILRMEDKLGNCGSVFKEYYDVNKQEFVEFPIYCDNRVCCNGGCKEHRGYKFSKTHSKQIGILNDSMKSPKGWVFTGYREPMQNFTRERLSYLLRLIYSICRRYSVSEFSIHMEIKINDDGSFYLHFHVVSGGFTDLSLVYREWKRVVKYEDAVRPENLSWYVSKYASKTPNFKDESVRDYYFLLVYKLKMHRFSPRINEGFKPIQADPKVPHYWFTVPYLQEIYERNARIKRRELLKTKPPPENVSKFVNVDLLEFDIKSALYRDSYLNPKSSDRVYHPYLEDRDSKSKLNHSLEDFNNG